MKSRTAIIVGAILGLGFLVRLLLWIGAGALEPVFDEHLYIEHATRLLLLGFYDGDWPPGYTAVVAVFLKAFGIGGLTVVRSLQVGCSLVTGALLMAFARRVFGNRAMAVTGILWAVYLPLAAFTHRFWPESIFNALFVSSVCLIWKATEQAATNRRTYLLTLAAGILWGLALLAKESITFLTIPVVVWIFYRRRRAPAEPLVFLMSVIMIVLPWTLRNYEVYGRFSLVGQTLYQNVLKGLNGTYVNHEYNHDLDLPWRAHTRSDGTQDFVATHLMNYGPGWQPSTKPNLIDRQNENLKFALAYAASHPTQFLATRIKKLADFLTPLSIFVRDLHGGVYVGYLAHPYLKRQATFVAIFEVLALVSMGWFGFIHVWRINREVAILLTILVAYFFATSLLFGMSRFRAPLEPFLMLLAGALVSKDAVAYSRNSRVLLLAGCVLLTGLWFINYREVITLIEQVNH